MLLAIVADPHVIPKIGIVLEHAMQLGYILVRAGDHELRALDPAHVLASAITINLYM